MSIAFSRSLRSLQTDSPSRWLRWLFWGVLALVLWGAWFWGAQVKVVAVTARAQLDVIRSTIPLEAAVAGRVLRSDLRLGQKVKAGQLLVELDASKPRLRLREERARLKALSLRLKALAAQVKAEKRSLYRGRRTSRAALRESQLQSKAAAYTARLARDKDRRSQRLYRKGYVSKASAQTARADAQKSQATAAALRVKSRRLRLEQAQRESDIAVRIAALQREQAKLQGEQQILAASCTRLAHDLKDYQILAPRDGHLGSVIELPKGALVQQGKRLGTLVARGSIKVIAAFAPADALGRIKAGQRGQLRLDGFPWVQYGSLAAEVSHVASVPEGGKIRVELQVQTRPGAKTAIPLKHGMPGALEIELERISPATLLLRAVGRMVAPRRPAPTTP